MKSKTSDMLDQLIKLTACEEYRQDGGMKVKEVVMKPWEKDEVRIILEIHIDDWSSDTLKTQTWELICEGLMFNTSSRIHEAKPPGTRIKVLADHPILWNYDNRTYFSITGPCLNIAELMGELFIDHHRLSGGWVAFHDLYFSLPETLKTQRKNQLSVPDHLLESCFNLLKKHNVEYVINSIEEGVKGLSVLLFSNSEIWPDEKCFGQPHIVARSFREKRIDLCSTG